MMAMPLPKKVIDLGRYAPNFEMKKVQLCLKLKKLYLNGNHKSGHSVRDPTLF